MSTLHAVSANPFGAAFQKQLSLLYKPENTAQLNNCQMSFEQFKALGLPLSKLEDWKYTNLSRYNFEIFKPALAEQANSETTQNLKIKDQWLIDPNSTLQWIFYNDTLLQQPTSTAWSEPTLSSLLLKGECKKNQMELLNSAFNGKGANIFIPENLVMNDPFYLIHIVEANTSGLMVHPKNKIIVGKNSKASIVELYLCLGEDWSFANTHTEIVLAEGASLNHVFIQRSDVKSLQIANVSVQQASHSHYLGNSIQAGGEVNRAAFNIELLDSAAHCEFYALELAGQQQQMDLQLTIQHQAPNTISKTISRGIIKDQAKGAFTGKIIVPKNASKTKALLENKNLLLSATAEANTRPQLFIDTNDIECSHGATVGTLDQDALFYLRSRGLPHAMAEQFLIESFIAPSLEGLPLNTQIYLNELIHEQ